MPISFWQNSILSVDYKKDSIDLRHCTISKSGAENWIVVCSSLHQTLRLQGRVSFFPKNTARQEFQEKIHFISNGWLHLSFRLIQMNAGPLQKKTTLLQLFEENDHESLAIVLMAKWHHSALQWFFLFLFDSICSFFMHLYKHIWLDECTLTWFLFHHVLETNKKWLTWRHFRHQRKNFSISTCDFGSVWFGTWNRSISLSHEHPKKVWADDGGGYLPIKNDDKTSKNRFSNWHHTIRLLLQVNPISRLKVGFNEFTSRWGHDEPTNFFLSSQC